MSLSNADSTMEDLLASMSQATGNGPTTTSSSSSSPTSSPASSTSSRRRGLPLSAWVLGPQLDSSSVWNPSVRFRPTITPLSLSSSSSAWPSVATPSGEIIRRRAVKELQARMEKLCVPLLSRHTGTQVCARLALKTSVTLRNGNAVFERWLFDRRLDVGVSHADPIVPTAAVEENGEGEGEGEGAEGGKGRGKGKGKGAGGQRARDKLMACGDFRLGRCTRGNNCRFSHTMNAEEAADARRKAGRKQTKPPAASKELFADLVEAGALKRAAHTVCLEMNDAVAAGGKKLVRLVATARPVGVCVGRVEAPKTAWKGGGDAPVGREGYHYEVRAAKTKGSVPPFRVNALHYYKLREMYRRRMADGAEGGADGTVSERYEHTETGFHEALFAVLCRYDTLGGSGYQAALPPRVFDVLHRRFDAGFECFASPLNSRCG